MYRDRFYVAWSDRLPVAKGEPLGEAEYPPCDDGNGCGHEPETAGRPTQVWTMRGADPDQVLIGQREGGSGWVVYGRLHAEPEDYFTFSGGEWHLRASAPVD